MSKVGILITILQILREGVRYLLLLAKTRDKRKMQAAIEAAEHYIRVNEKYGEYARLSPKKRKQYLIHYSKRFWAYNN